MREPYKKGEALVKRCMVLLCFFSVVMLLTACSSKPSIELVKTSVDVINDQEIVGAQRITEGDKKGQDLVPTALYYEFTLKNTGKKKIGDTGDTGLEIQINPHDPLVASSKEIIGFNVFNPSEYDESGLGYGQTFVSILEPGQEGLYTLHYELGVSEEDPPFPFLVPPKEQLEKLKNVAKDATLLILLDGEELARFDLQDL
ncbi:hypothetical protein ACIQXQ_03495 [Peribacillus sp. NPDC097198]|uniref:hypothetical protein n=1 Tax=Peribacillus sp. NPDC097198 TaxID=3364397 RepID=UPI003803D76C